jgi:hypothetical protein
MISNNKPPPIYIGASMASPTLVEDAGTHGAFQHPPVTPSVRYRTHGLVIAIGAVILSLTGASPIG